MLWSRVVEYRRDDVPSRPGELIANRTAFAALGLERMSLTPPLTEIEELYNLGLFVRAYSVSQAFGPLKDWEGAEAKVFAGRLAGVLGAQRLSVWSMLRAYRQHPSNPTARLYYGYHLLHRRGPLVAAQWLSRHDLAEGSPRQQCDWLGLRANSLAQLRDFRAADECLRRAEGLIGTPYAWLEIERARVLEAQARHDEGIAAARCALEIKRDYRPALHALADLLAKVGRRADAIELLGEATPRLECGDLEYTRASLLIDMERHEEAISALERAVGLWPLCDHTIALFVAAKLETACYLAGQRERAADFARFVGGEFHEDFADRLMQPDFEGRRTALPLDHVQQQADTCAPATLTMIARYWSRPVDHVELAEKICFDGTPHHAQRKWAEENGFVARAFTVTPDVAHALIDHGMPFALMTAAPGWSHLQTVVGYDDYRRTLLVRDPNSPLLTEYMLEQTLESNRYSGPQGMVLVPREEAARLDSIELPDAEHRDRLYEIDLALLGYDREAAGRWLHDQREAAPHHFLTIHARRILARYDNDWETLLQCAELLSSRCPEDPIGYVDRCYCLRELDRRESWMELLAQAEQKFTSDVFLKVMLASEWAYDARRWPEAERRLRQALRRQPCHAEALNVLGNLRWGQLRRDEALQLLRWAACVEDKKEPWSQGYFSAAWDHQRLPEALEFLEDRVRRYGARSAGPVTTLAGAFERLGQPDRGLELMESALRQRPEDGDLLLAAAGGMARQHRWDEARRYLERARGRASSATWNRAAARVALQRGDLETAAGHWEAVVAAAPLDAGAYRELALLLQDSVDHAAAVARLRAAVERFPFNYRLQQVLIEFLSGAHPVEHLAAVRRLLEQHPVDVWAHRELALGLMAAGQPAEAEAEADLGVQLDPASASSWYIRGVVRSAAQRVAEARDDFHEALRCDCDWTSALARAMELAATRDEHRQTLRVHFRELLRQGNVGPGIEAYAQSGRDFLTADELRSDLEKLHAARPDVWQTWVVLAELHIQQQRLDYALDIAQGAAARFPQLPWAWEALASVRSAREESAAEAEALERARRLPSASNSSARRLALLRREAGDLAAACEVLEAALSQNPSDASTAALLAETLWNRGEREAAIETIRRALRFAPHFTWAWEQYERWSRESGSGQEVVDAARSLVARRPGEADSWVNLAQRLNAPEEIAERIAAIDRALQIDPRSVDALQLKAYALADQGDLAAAIQVAEANHWAGRAPASLRATAADLVARTDLAQGVRRLEALVQDEPSYAWAWRQLAEWRRVAEQWGDCLRVAEHWTTALDPHDAIGWGYLGDACAHCGQTDRAIEAFVRAIQLDPSYVYAALSLADLQMDAQRYSQAASTLDGISAYEREGLVELRMLRLACLQRDDAEIDRKVGALCQMPDIDPGLARWCADHLRAAGRLQGAQSIIRSRLLEPEAGEFVAAFWLATMPSRASAGRALVQWTHSTASWGRVALRWLQSVIDANDAPALRGSWRGLRRRLAAETQLWAQAGLALGQLVRPGRAERWMADYAQRRDREQWMMGVLAHFQWLQRRYRPLERSVVDGLNLPDDGTAHGLWAYRAAAALVQGDLRLAASHVAQSRDAARTNTTNYQMSIMAIVEALVAEGENPLQDFRLARQRIWYRLRSIDSELREQLTLRRLAHMGLYRLARARGSWFGALYHLFQARVDFRMS